MVNQRKVLEFIAEESRQDRFVSCGDLGEEFDLHPEAASGHLKRLWRERLVRTRDSRPRRFKYRLHPGESIQGLRFRLASRGKERLEWYRKADEDDWF